LLENLKNTGWKWELIIVDDGSGDGTQLREITDNTLAHLITFENNKGKGQALRAGFNAARGSIQIFTDPDIPYEFEAITRIVKLISNGEAGLVIGNRLLKDSVY